MKKIIAIFIILMLALPMVIAKERGIARALERANDNALENSRMLSDEERYNETMNRQQEMMEINEEHKKKQEEMKKEVLDGMDEEKFKKKVMKYTEWRDKKIAKMQKKFQEMQMKGELEDEEMRKLALMNEFTRKELEELNKEELQKKLAAYQVIKYDKMQGFKKRMLDEQEKEKKHKKMQELKKEYQENKKAIDKNKEDFKELKDAIEKCSNQTDCPEAFEKARDLLLKQLATIQNYNARLKEKIESNEYLDDTTAKEKIKEIQIVIDEINKIAEKVKTATKVKELEELRRDAIKTWKRVKYTLHNQAIGVIENKFNGLFKRMEHMDKRLEVTLEENPEAKEEFKDEVAKFDSLLESARKSLKEARELSYKATGKGDEAMVKDARKALKKSLDEMKEAHKILVKILKSLKEKNLELEQVDEVLVETS